MWLVGKLFYRLYCEWKTLRRIMVCGDFDKSYSFIFLNISWKLTYNGRYYGRNNSNPRRLHLLLTLFLTSKQSPQEIFGVNKYCRCDNRIFIFYMYLRYYICMFQRREGVKYCIIKYDRSDEEEVTNRKVRISVVTYAQTHTQDV